MSVFRALFFLLVVSSIASFAQPWRPYRSRVIVGGASIEGQLASTVAIPSPLNISFGKDGKLYFNSFPQGTFSIDEDGIIRASRAAAGVQAFAVTAAGTTYAVNGGAISIQPLNGVSNSYSPQVPGSFPFFTGIAADSLGRAYAADQRGGRIFRVDSSGNFTIVGGSGSQPIRLAIDGSNRLIFSASDGQVWRMYPSSSPEVMAGPVSLGAIAAASDGTIYFADQVKRNVMRIVDGRIETAVENVTPGDMAVDGSGRLLFTTGSPPQIWRVEPNGTRVRIAGLENIPPPGGSETTLNNPGGLALDLQGNLLIADTDQNRILRRTLAGEIEIVSNSTLRPGLLAVGADGAVYFATNRDRLVKRLSTAGQVESFAGDGNLGSSGDNGPATQASFDTISGILTIPRGLAIADLRTNKIRIVEASGIIRALAGNGEQGLGEDGVPATSTAMGNPGPMAMDRSGNLVVYELLTNRFRRISPAGIISSLPFLGFMDSQSYDRCRLDGSVSSIVIDSTNSILFSSRGAICRVEPDGRGWLVNATYGTPVALAIDADDRVYVADNGGNRIYLLEPGGFEAPYALQSKISGVVGAGGSRNGSVTQYSLGALLTIYGSGFAPAGTSRAVTAADLVGGALPTRLAGVCVLLGGVRAPLTFVGEAQINFQAPTSGTASGDVKVVANCDGVQEFTSLAFRMDSRTATPELLYWTSTGSSRSPVVAVDASTNAYIGIPNLISGLTFRPAKPGDVLTIYGISFGATNPIVEAGLSASGPSSVRGSAQVYINNQLLRAANVLYIGASPGIAGLYQINLRVPDVADGDHPIRVVVDSQSSPSDGYLTVRRAN